MLTNGKERAANANKLLRLSFNIKSPIKQQG